MGPATTASGQHSFIATISEQPPMVSLSADFDSEMDLGGGVSYNHYLTIDLAFVQVWAEAIEDRSVRRILARADYKGD